MAGYQRVIGRRAIRHADVNSTVHQEDVERNNERKSVFWIGVEQHVEEKHRILPQLGGDLLFVRDSENGDLLHVNGDEHTRRMDAWNSDLSWYLREIRDSKCKNGKRWKRTRTNGIQGNVVTASPWYSNVIFSAAQNGQAEKVLELAQQAAVDLAHSFQKLTRRRVLSVQAHFDSPNLHWHIFSSRIGPDHHFMPGTAKKIGLVGPWCVGVLRQHQAGVLHENSTNLKVARRLFARNEQRLRIQPIDWQMAKIVDNLCYAAFGSSPLLTYWLQIYKIGFGDMCIDRLTALREATDREIACYKTQMDYLPSEAGFKNVSGTNVLLI